MENPPEFQACVEQLNSRYVPVRVRAHAQMSWISLLHRIRFLLLLLHSYSECGIDVGEIKVIAYVSQLKWIEHKPSETIPLAYELVKQWDDKKWVPVAIQTLIECCMPEKGPKFKLVHDLLRGRSVVLAGSKSHYYGETATVADTQSLETNGRVHSEYETFSRN